MVVLSNFVNFLLSLPILLLFVLFFKRPIGLAILSLPVVMLIQLVFTTGLAFMFSALCVHYRDVQHILANFLNLWFFLTPIIYSPDQVSGILKFIISLNPVAPVILAYRNIFYESQFPNFMQLSAVAAMAVFIYLLGGSVFERYRVIFAEEV